MRYFLHNILSSRLWSVKFSLSSKTLYGFLTSLLCSSWWLISTSVIWASSLNIWAVQIVKLPIMEHPIACWYFLPLGSKYSRNILQLSSAVTVYIYVELRLVSDLDMSKDRSCNIDWNTKDEWIKCWAVQHFPCLLKHFIIQQMHKYIIRRYN